MAKKKLPPMADDGEKITVVALKGTRGYWRWLNSISDESLISVSAIIRDALAKWAKDKGYPAPPKL